MPKEKNKQTHEFFQSQNFFFCFVSPTANSDQHTVATQQMSTLEMNEWYICPTEHTQNSIQDYQGSVRSWWGWWAFLTRTQYQYVSAEIVEKKYVEIVEL